MSAKAVFCWKHYKNSVFSRAQLLCITDSKTPFRGKTQNGTFATKTCHFGFSPVPAETPIFVVFGDFDWAQKKGPFPKRDSATKMRAFFTFRTQIVFAYFLMPFLQNIFFVHNHPKNTIFFFIFVFHFSYFLFFFLQHKKDKNKKCTIFFFETLFLTPWQTAQEIFAPLHTI